MIRPKPSSKEPAYPFGGQRLWKFSPVASRSVQMKLTLQTTPLVWSLG